MISTKITPTIIGLSGTFASGKDTLARQLEADFGYRHVSTADIVRRVAMAERGSIERPVLFEVATKHRREDGAGYFAKEALRGERPLIVSGIRSLGEVKEIRSAGGVMVFVDAPIGVRYQRMLARKRDTEVELTLGQFQVNEEKEMYSGPGDGDFNLRAIKSGADVVVENVLNRDEFIETAYRLLGLS